MKKILFFAGGSYVAGLEIVTLQLMKGLKDRGYEVSCVVTGWNDGDFKNRLTTIGVTYYEIKIGWLYLTKPSWTMDTLLNYPKAYRQCKRAIKEWKPDVMHFTSYPMAIMLYPLIGKNSFYILHDTQLPNLKHRIIYKLLNYKIKHFVAVSGLISSTLQKMKIPLHKIRVIHNGVQDGDYPAPKNYLENGKVNFAIVGQVAAWKGHELLINAVELLVKKGIQNFTVAIVGKNDNAYSSALVKLMEEKKLSAFFSWKGFIGNQADIYKNIDAVLVPSMSTPDKYFEESFSLSTAEGMIRGLAVIATNKGGMKELIDHKKNGLLFTEGDPVALSDCMAGLITNKNLIGFLGANAQKKAKAHFTSEAMTEKYIAAYFESNPLANE